MIFINFKTYPQSSGENAIKLVRTICDVADETGVEIISCPQAVDLRKAVRVCNHPASPTKTRRSWVWAQHVDSFKRGRATGWIPAEVAREAGVEGVLLNHSEHKFGQFQELEKAVKRAKEVGLKTLVFVANLEELKKVVFLNPTFIAYESPELVGSKTTSVAKAEPEIISEAVEITKENELPLIVGAGIKSREDVRKSLELGAVGVAVSSDIVTARDPKKELLDLIKGFN